MLRGLKVILLSLVMGLVALSPVWAVTTWYNLKDYEKLTGKKIESFNEAPMLRTKVAAGELPPLEERLPEEPVVMLPEEKIGQYGGTWRRVWLGSADRMMIVKTMIEPLVKYNPRDISEVIPGLAKSWEISEDGKVYTFHLRKGLKWSDGVPFTADDMLFYYEDVLLNKELTPIFPKCLVTGGEPVEFEKIDDYTVRFTFKEVYALFLQTLAYYSTGGYFYAPKHYMKQFHPRYTPMNELEKRVKEAGLEEWYQLYGLRIGFKEQLTDPDCPTVSAWMAVNSLTSPRFVMTRNPYYWMVDPEGNQLPYIDRVTCDLVVNADMINLKAMSGEVDMQRRRLMPPNYSLFKENEEKGDYRVLRNWKMGDHAAFFPNLTCKDLVLREFLQDDRFRKALSLAINREEINEFCFQGLTEPGQTSFDSASPYYSEEWEKAYAEFDPQRANALLDEIGLTKKDKEGFRLRPDGKTLSLTILYVPQSVVNDAVVELVTDYWAAIGIKVFGKSAERSLYLTRIAANDYEIMGRPVTKLIKCLIDPGMIIPIRGWGHAWGHEYGRWYDSGGKAGEKPPKDIARMQEIWDKLKVTIDEEERRKLVEEVIQLHIKNIWMIGIVRTSFVLAVAKNNFRNVPEELIYDEITGATLLACPQQFFFEQK